MSWSGAITVLEALLTAAGTASATTPFSIQAGEPGVPPRKMIAWWWDGDGENPLLPETLTDHPYGDNVTIRAYWPVATRSAGPAETLETEIRALNRAIKAALELDRTLGDNCEVATIGDASSGWLSADNGWWRTLTIPLVLGFTDLEPIAR